MKETKPYWYDNKAYTIDPYFVCLDLPNLTASVSFICLSRILSMINFLIGSQGVELHLLSDSQGKT